MQIAFNSLRVLIFRVILVLLGMALGILIARWLGPSGNGLYTLATYYGAIGTTLMGGGVAAVAHDISHRGVDPHTAAANVAVFSLGLGFIPAVAALAALPFLMSHGWWWLLPVALAQPLALLNASLVGVFLGVDDMKGLNYAYLGPWAATLAALVAVVLLFGATTRAVLIAWALGQCLAAVYSLWLARSLWRPLALHSVTWGRQRELLHFGVQAGLANVVGLLNYRADAFMVQIYLGQTQLGIYSAGVKVAEALWFFSQAISTAAYARIGSGTIEESARLAARGTRHSLFVIGILAIGMLVLANPLVSILFGHAYLQAIAPFRWLVPGIAFYGLASVISAYYTNRLGRPRVALLIAGFSMLLNLAACTLLIPAFGLSGAAMASTLGYTVAIAAGVVAFHRSTGLGWREILVIDGDDLRDYLRFAERLLRLVREASPAAPR